MAKPIEISASKREAAESPRARALNANTVSIISGTPGGTYFRMASDIAFVLDSADLRVLPILGKGAGQNAYDLLFLKGVDLGFIRTDTLDQLKQDKSIGNAYRSLAYVARLFNDELHVIASRELSDVRQLSGKKVSFDVKGSGTDYTGRAMFEGVGLKVEALNIDQPAALELLQRGEIAGVVSVAAKPVAVVTSFDGADRFHLLSFPYAEALADRYYPAELSNKDYPKLVVGGNVNTLAVGTILGAFNHQRGSERYNRVTRFVDAFFSKFEEFQKSPRHPKWQEVNLAATVPNWTRFPASEEWLQREANKEIAGKSSEEFKRFFDTRKPGASTERDDLYREFLDWKRRRSAL